MVRKLYNDSDVQRVVLIPPAAGGDEAYRTPWRRDYARVTHSAAFRRLQGKTQVFPNHESDFFRNRLTHSLEVAQVAKSIAIRLNNTEKALEGNFIDTDLVEIAALAHDLGHPPFGHNGEEILDKCMINSGGFEGNAQTLRILAKLEKRQTLTVRDHAPIPVLRGVDERVGLNLTYRTLASVLKYDKKIPFAAKDRDKDDKIKGYYHTEMDLVEKIKNAVGVVPGKKFKTIECSIMDVADDIAYSTYDLEDAFKAKFFTPLSMFSSPQHIVDEVVKNVDKRLKAYCEDLDPAYLSALTEEDKKFDSDQFYHVLLNIFGQIFGDDVEELDMYREGRISKMAAQAAISSRLTSLSEKTATQGYSRTQLTSDLVGRFIKSIRFSENADNIALSQVYLDVVTFKQVETLKNLTYQSLIMSSMLKVARYRGHDIIKKIFDALNVEDGHLLMPEDFRQIFLEVGENRSRVICDFIAGMTDRYAIQFFGRLCGTNPESIYSPL